MLFPALPNAPPSRYRTIMAIAKAWFRRRLTAVLSGLHRCHPCRACGRPTTEPICPACAANSGLGLLHAVPGASLLGLDRAWYLAHYRSSDGRRTAVAALLLRFKYRNDRAAGHTIATILERGARPLRGHYDIVAPVPADRQRLYRRGYNQAAWLARAAARAARARVRPSLLRRTRAGPAQVGGTRVERRSNTAGVFTCTGADIDGARVLLIDDVVTTGSTLRAAALALRRHCACRVDALVVCAVQPHRSGPVKDSRERTGSAALATATHGTA